MATPSEFRVPVRRAVALALAVFFSVTGQDRLALWMLVSFHAMPRPLAEGARITNDDWLLLDAPGGFEYPGVYGIMRLRQPKTARNPAHARFQHVLLLDRALAL